MKKIIIFLYILFNFGITLNAQNVNLFQKWKWVEYYSWEKNENIDTIPFLINEARGLVTSMKRAYGFKEGIYHIHKNRTYTRYSIISGSKKSKITTGSIDVSKLILNDETDGERIILMCDKELMIIGYRDDFAIYVYIPFCKDIKEYNLLDNYIRRFAKMLVK